ncbi:MAG: CDP-alcohol phosphatidyltransferase family protein [Oscillospiraceae bacterium]
MRHVPNILSCLRILLIPVFVWQLLIGNTTAAAVILAGSGITDLLDGYLARHYNWISDLGKVLDPVADKLTQVTVCVVLAYLLSDYMIFFIIMFLKEVLMMALGGYLLKKGAHIDGARWFGKAATVCFYVSMTILVLFPMLPKIIAIVLLCGTTALVLFAFSMYIPMFFKLKRGTAVSANKGD